MSAQRNGNGAAQRGGVAAGIENHDGIVGICAARHGQPPGGVVVVVGSVVVGSVVVGVVVVGVVVVVVVVVIGG